LQPTWTYSPEPGAHLNEEELAMTEPLPTEERTPYESPAVVYESELEVRAGSPLGIPNLLDLTGTDE
jgi:hypothetical protein